MGHSIDIKKWNRRPHYDLFRKYRQPFFSVTADVDVTGLWKRCRRRDGPPFFLTSLFLMLSAVNDTRPFRLRLRRRGVWLHDAVAVGPTILRSDDTFGFVRIKATRTLGRFLTAGKAAIARTMLDAALEPMNRTDDIVFHSVLPWFRFTSFTNALPGNDSIPRIVFGKTTVEPRRVTMPIAVEVHHALVDGLDVARFLERFQAKVDAPLPEA